MALGHGVSPLMGQRAARSQGLRARRTLGTRLTEPMPAASRRTTASAIPSPPARGVLGHQPAYAADPLGTFRRWSANYGPAIRLRFGPIRALLLTSPEAVEDVLVRQEAAFRKAPVVRRLARRVIGDSLFTAEGEAWRRQRELLREFFRRGRIEAHAPLIAREVGAMLDRWRAGETIPAFAETMRLSQRIAGQVLFGVEVNDDDVERVGNALAVTAADFQHGIDHPLALAVPDWLPSPRRSRRRRAVAALDDVVQRMIETRRRDGRDGSDLLGELLRRQSSLPWLTDRLIRDNVLTLLTESREDPALLLTWSLSLLAHDPDVAERVAKEADEVLGRGVPVAEDLGRLRVTSTVLHEALRLYPPVYGTGREARRDCVIAGVPVRRGTIVLLGQDAMNRDPQRYPEPDAFRPDRWHERPAEALPVGAYTPFNIGPRRCLGEPLAWAIGLIGVAMLARDIRLEAIDPRPVEPAVMLSLRPSREVWLRIEARR